MRGLAEAKHRGRIIAFDNLSVALGQLMLYRRGAALTDVPHDWRLWPPVEFLRSF